MAFFLPKFTIYIQNKTKIRIEMRQASFPGRKASLRNNVFSNLRGLRYLDLTHCELSFLPVDMFANTAIIELR